MEMLKLFEDYSVKISVHRFFHVAIARLMELTNILQKLSHSSSPEDLTAFLNGFILLLRGLYPFSPHLSSELWSNLS